MKTIEDAIHQKHFPDLRIKTDINIMYTSGWVSAHKHRILRPFGLTPQQFNILRILRGVAPGCVSMRYLADRMIDPTSNASRLVDKLVDKGWVDRRECPTDRRQVEIRITPDGLDQVGRTSDAIQEGARYYDHLTEEEMRQLNFLLDKVRNH